MLVTPPKLLTALFFLCVRQFPLYSFPFEQLPQSHHLLVVVSSFRLSLRHYALKVVLELRDLILEVRLCATLLI